MKRILAALDLSAHSDRAFARAAQIAGAHGAELTLARISQFSIARLFVSTLSPTRRSLAPNILGVCDALERMLRRASVFGPALVLIAALIALVLGA